MNKWRVLACVLLVQACLGSIFAWSAFVDQLRGAYGFSTAQTQMVFGATIALFTFSMVFAGRLLETVGPRVLTAIGGILFGVGYVIASYSQGSFPLVLLGIGCVTGIGVGCGYVCPLTIGMAWFPKNKGLITGVAVAGFGAGAIALSAGVGYMYSRGLDCLSVFRVVGLTYGAVVLLGAAGLGYPTRASEERHKEEVDPGNYLQDRRFRRLLVGMFSGTFAGLLVIGNIRQIGVEAKVVTAAATLAISSFAVGNAFGRISWGWISDRIGSFTIPASLISLSICIGALFVSTRTGAGYVIAASAVGFCFGGCFVLYAAQVARIYGAKNLGRVYPIVFLAYGVAGILGPTLGGWLRDSTGSYALPIAVASLVALCGGSFTIIDRLVGNRTVASKRPSGL